MIVLVVRVRGCPGGIGMQKSPKRICWPTSLCNGKTMTTTRASILRSPNYLSTYLCAYSHTRPAVLYSLSPISRADWLAAVGGIWYCCPQSNFPFTCCSCVSHGKLNLALDSLLIVDDSLLIVVSNPISNLGVQAACRLATCCSRCVSRRYLLTPITFITFATSTAISFTLFTFPPVPRHPVELGLHLLAAAVADEEEHEREREHEHARGRRDGCDEPGPRP